MCSWSSESGRPCWASASRPSSVRSSSRVSEPRLLVSTSVHACGAARAAAPPTPDQPRLRASPARAGAARTCFSAGSGTSARVSTGRSALPAKRPLPSGGTRLAILSTSARSLAGHRPRRQRAAREGARGGLAGGRGRAACRARPSRCRAAHLRRRRRACGAPGRPPVWASGRRTGWGRRTGCRPSWWPACSCSDASRSQTAYAGRVLWVPEPTVRACGSNLRRCRPFQVGYRQRPVAPRPLRRPVRLFVAAASGASSALC